VTCGAGCELCDGCDIYGTGCGISVIDNIDIYIHLSCLQGLKTKNKKTKKIGHFGLFAESLLRQALGKAGQWTTK
jgi:hypothetical protein